MQYLPIRTTVGIGILREFRYVVEAIAKRRLDLSSADFSVHGCFYNRCRAGRNLTQQFYYSLHSQSRKESNTI